MQQITLSLYLVVTVFAFAAALVYSKAAVRLLKEGLKNKATVVAMGIVFGFTHIVLIYVWWTLFYVFPDWQKWMINNPIILLNTSIGILGAICHIRSATYDKLKNIGWMSVGVIAVITGVWFYYR